MEAKKKVLIIIGIILGSIAILALVLGFSLKNRDDRKNNNSETNNPSTTFNKTISRLDNESEFFTMQKVINDFYTLMVNKDREGLFKILDEEYKNENKITESNVISKFANNYSTTSYIAKEIYYNKDSNITYYFINGYFVNYGMMEEDGEYLSNVNYLVIVSNGGYVIKPIPDNINIGNYARSYKLEEIKIDNGEKIERVNLDLEDKLLLYLSEFYNNIMLNDSNKAYNMLDNKTKKKYPTITDFQNNYGEIWNKYTATIFSYAKQEYKNYTVYNIVDNNQNKVTITEYNIMDYKIAF